MPIIDDADLWPRLKAWYREQALRLLQERVRHWGAQMGLKPGPVALKEWRRRWGECHPDGTLKFNWRLILCPPAVIDYVVVHELAHLLVPGHNPRFWGRRGQGLAGLCRPPPLAEPGRRPVSPVAGGNNSAGVMPFLAGAHQGVRLRQGGHAGPPLTRRIVNYFCRAFRRCRRPGARR